MNDENNTDNGIVLKFKAVVEKLDYAGNVIEETKTAEYTWSGYDPEVFLMSTIRHGDLSAVPNPISDKHAADLYVKLFDKSATFDRWEMLNRCKSIETEPMNGMKFVVYDRKNQDMKMHWTAEDEDIRKEAK